MEIQALRNLRHPHVIRILDVADNPDSVCFIMERAAGGELRRYVERHGLLSEDEARVFFKQIIGAVHYIHNKKIIHRDLKLENILLDSNNRCKIVDFGLSDYVTSKERTVTDAGTEAYLAPEVYAQDRKADPFKLDVWSLGVILYAMTHGKLPFSRPDAEVCSQLESDAFELKSELSSGCKRLIRAMLTPNPERRASVVDITLDPWVTKNRFASCDDEDHSSDSHEEEEPPVPAVKSLPEVQAPRRIGRPQRARTGDHLMVSPRDQRESSRRRRRTPSASERYVSSERHCGRPGRAGALRGSPSPVPRHKPPR